MIDFKPIDLTQKELYQHYMNMRKQRSCEFSFTNMYMWGTQEVAMVDNYMVALVHMNGTSVYRYPVGYGAIQPVIDAIIQDAKERGIPCKIAALSEADIVEMSERYPDRFSYQCERDTYDYLYAIDDLATLKGRKYHSKRNHIKRFCTDYPDYTVEPIHEDNIDKARGMIAEWFKQRIEEGQADAYELEQVALERAFDKYQELELEGMMLIVAGEVVAVTMGSKLSDEIFDVHFEKAKSDVRGAYTVINYEFAKYIKEKYPKVLYIDREEDMGIEGLRKAKESYYPHHLIEKCWAYLLEDTYEDR